VDIKLEINKVVKNGNPKATISTVILWLIYSINSNLNFSYNFMATINEKIQDTMLNASLIKPLNVATTHDIRMILIIIISTILKYVFSKNSITLT
jgi:hypothetical protein